MSFIYSADDFDINGNFVSTGRFQDLPNEGNGLTGHVPSFNEIDWNDPALYTMPLTSDEIAAIMSNTNNSLPNLPPGLPPPTSDPLSRQLSESRSPLPDFPPPTSDPPLCQPSEARSPSPERSKPLREANSSSWAARNCHIPYIRLQIR
ncbi:hypothetical protein DFJ58DRAFT_725122 [Suillus subalutaceus]|uniref:uncharacterized protein n=1 Tax=Suillus subalutaceus TaxID=48586 RepID=UPI001B87BA5B|nr:uncharacterized protein DFJ58DRAFT_725122 [Suillus subalutaceus]KAG1863225.1 hypothetical protein DFJ58DRAFT_725122 [Suillus subalutaceus]